MELRELLRRRALRLVRLIDMSAPSIIILLEVEGIKEMYELLRREKVAA
jgi:hypothetical protein